MPESMQIKVHLFKHPTLFYTTALILYFVHIEPTNFLCVVFRADILPTCDCFIYLKDNLASQTLSISAAVLITYQAKGLACETKPTICKHKQKQMQPSLNRHELVQRSLTRYKHVHHVPHTEHVESLIRQMVKLEAQSR